jgi:hypothetical protein
VGAATANWTPKEGIRSDLYFTRAKPEEEIYAVPEGAENPSDMRCGERKRVFLLVIVFWLVLVQVALRPTP